MIYAFTSAALNYLPKARLCLGSLRRFHPEFKLVYALADRLPPGTAIAESCVDEVIAVEDLPELAAPGWIFQHTIVELSTAIKGAVLQRLLARPDCEAVLYFDPDIVLFSRLDDLVGELMAANLVLTPHQAKPEATAQRIVDNEICSLKYGIFNLGFLGVRRTPVGTAFADWWAERLRLFCFDRLEQGLFTDQKWLNHAPVFFDGVGVLKEPRFNVATWNITTRAMTGTAPDQIEIDGKPLGFYHFTGFDSGAHGIMAERNGAGNATLQGLIAWYREAIRVAEGDQLAQLPWAFGRYSDGTAIEPWHRRVYGIRANLRKAYRDPFDASDRATGEFASLLAWLKARAALEFPGWCGDEADRMQAMTAENERLMGEIRAMKSSMSWRVTRPLRMLG